MSYQAKSKVFATKDGKLVEEGHPDSHVLVAGSNAIIVDGKLSAFSDAEKAKFFVEINPRPKSTHSERKRIAGEGSQAEGKGDSAPDDPKGQHGAHSGSKKHK